MTAKGSSTGAYIKFWLSHKDEAAARQWPGESLSLAAKRDLARYYAILDEELRRIDLSTNELGLIRDALDAAKWQADPHVGLVNKMPVAVAHYLREHPESASQWEVEAGSLLRTIAERSPCAYLAIFDAVERIGLG